ncbi:MAG: hypothetical protein JXB23_08520 [Candidatus Aminicenantes bacterium]|nr:hypothetical protein [Candidatus Aminicenantes bacterium]
MRDKRRRIFYVDRVFQKKLLFFFLGWNLVVVSSNFLFYSFHLRNLVEDHLYRSHIPISNMAEIFTVEVIRFNLILAGVTTVAFIIFYVFVRSRIRSFFRKIRMSLQHRLNRGGEDIPAVSFSEEFADIDTYLQDFFKDVDKMMGQNRKRISSLKETLTTLDLEEG